MAKHLVDRHLISLHGGYDVGIAGSEPYWIVTNTYVS